MSHAKGIVFSISGEIVGHFEFSMSTETVISPIYKTEEELDKNYRTGTTCPACTCGSSPEAVIFYYDCLGGEYYWEGKVCLTCRAVVQGKEPHWEEIKEKEGHPCASYAGGRLKTL